MNNIIIGVVIGLTLSVVLHAFIPCKAERDYRDGAITHNAAYYHPTTGKFTWKDLNDTME